MERPKTEANLGTLWRSAVCLGASYIFTIGGRYRHQASDTVKSWKQIPYFAYADLGEFMSARPREARIVGFELHDAAVPLATFSHPTQAIYLLGPEDGSLSSKATAVCDHLVVIDSRFCLNVASAGTVALYDRNTKLDLKRQPA